MSLQPAAGSNGNYSYVEEGDLVVDVSGANPQVDAAGLNPSAVTTFDDVFSIEYGGSEYARVWITHESDAVSFYARNHPIESVEDAVVVGPDGSVPVGLQVNSTGAIPGDLLKNITVHARVAEPPTQTQTLGSVSIQSVRSDGRRQFSVEDARAGEPVTLDGQSLLVSEFGRMTLEELRVSSRENGAFDLTVRRVDASNESDRGFDALGAVAVEASAPEASGVFRFEMNASAFEDANVSTDQLVVRHLHEGAQSTRPVRVVGRSGDRVVLEAETPNFSTFVVGVRRPSVDVVDASVNRSTVAVNDAVAVSAVVANRGEWRGNRTIVVRAGESVVATQMVSLDAGERTNVTAVFSPSEPGEVEVRAGNATATVRVTADQTTTRTTPTTTNAGADERSTSTVRTTTTETAGSTTERPPAEQSGFRLREVVGFAGVAAFVVVVLALARWRSREN
ncbi:DUF1102 domain-containing protein [Salarchaeum japonicum]|uniref:DUF1102 domain-containing protein n=1 Tax=Salarchaeum japonicum TaxID=555573 RepID=UPI003C734A76